MCDAICDHHCQGNLECMQWLWHVLLQSVVVLLHGCLDADVHLLILAQPAGGCFLNIADQEQASASCVRRQILSI